MEGGEFAERLLGDPIQKVGGGYAEREDLDMCWGMLEEEDLFEKRHDNVICIKKARTNTNMNPVCGFQIVPEWDAAFRSFIERRDKAYAQAKRKECRDLIKKQREARKDDDMLELLFEAVADAFVDLMRAGHPFAFKYCPTPGSSADKATGTLGSGGIAQAIMTRMGFPGIFMDHVSFACFFSCLWLIVMAKY